MNDILKKCTEPDDNIYRNIMRFHGHKRQIAKCIEEMAELITELSKFSVIGADNTVEIKSEIADVGNILVQMRILFDSKNEIPGIMYAKMKREQRRIMEGNYGND